ncbi:MAG: glycosyltransferase family 39 protein [Paenibacillus sp.]|nr:glycosyltransferase family 39 protein [Paenibacillus sp.]
MLWSRLQRGYNYCRNNPWPVVLFLLGAGIRIFYIGSIPGGLNQDEASIGYDAFSILHYGMDRNGMYLPVHLTAWGSGQNALYAYLSMPFILLFGLTPFSVRAVSLIMGLLGMMIFYLFSKTLFKSKSAGIAAMFFIAINPWHIMMSRWALESNLFPTLILITAYFALKAFQSPKWSYGFTVCGALSLYAYGTAYFFVPLFAVGIALYLLCTKKLSLRAALWNVGVFVLLALPILLFIIINHWKLPSIDTLLFSIPKLTTPRVEEISSVFGGDMWGAAGINFQNFLNLIISGSDGLPWNTINPYGYAYPIGLPFAVLGLVVMLKSVWKKEREAGPSFIILLWLAVSILMSFITSVNINRINIIFYPIIFFIVEGFLWLAHKVKVAGVVSAALFGLFFVLFATVYFRDYPRTIGPAFYESIGEAVHYASSESEGKIYVTTQVNMPYIYVLFYEKINPHDFLETVHYTNPGDAFQQVSSFGRYVFGRSDITSMEKAAYIIWNGEALPPESQHFSVTKFKNYSVLIPKDE